MDLQEESLRIRDAVASDAEILCSWWNNGEVMAHAGFPNGIHTTVDEVTDQIAENNDQNRRLIIEWDDIPIGEMNYRMMAEHTAEMGIKICVTDCQNRGYGTKYLRMLISYLFNTMDCTKIILDTNVKNQRAQHVYESLGFNKIRTNIDSWKNQVGEMQSSIDYELSREGFTGKGPVMIQETDL